MADSLQSMRELLENEPAMVENMVDWKKILANIGLNVTDDDASEVFEKAKNIALRLIADKLNGEEEDGNKNEVYFTLNAWCCHCLSINRNYFTKVQCEFKTNIYVHKS